MFRVVCLTMLALANNVLARQMTPLEINNNLCKAENIKNQRRYTCDAKGNIRCQNGWTNANDTNPLFPCTTPVCSNGCENGICEGPDLCACDVGWEGLNCSTCIDLPGCVNGHCNGKGLSCECDLGWKGGFCDTPSCTNCVNGQCIAPGQCKCYPGWQGPNCDQCVPLNGCNVPRGGNCIDPNNSTIQIPNGCLCEPGFTGHLCDEPLCDPSCVAGHGECIFGNPSNQSNPICRCEVGWIGGDCGMCTPYPGCPTGPPANGTCVLPYQCMCSPGSTNILCNIQEK